MRDENQLHAAVVEIVALDDAAGEVLDRAELVPGRQGRQVGGIYNFVTKRGACRGRNSKISWTQVETGSAITWKYPSVHAAGRQLDRRVLLGRDDEQPPAGGHRNEDDPHRARTRRSTIVSKGISAGFSGQQSYRGLVQDHAGSADNARNFSQCDSMLLGDKCGAHTFPYIEVKNPTATDGARGDDVEDRRGPDLLLPPARHLGRGRGVDDRQRLLQGGLLASSPWSSRSRRRAAELSRSKVSVG